MTKLEKLADQTMQIGNSVKKVKTKQLKEVRKLHAVEKALNRSTTQQLENL